MSDSPINLDAPIDDSLDGRELIEAIRGVRGRTTGVCDFCGKPTLAEHLQPEEAGDWICDECIKRCTDSGDHWPNGSPE